jgi:predicted metal-binding membrane protein
VAAVPVSASGSAIARGTRAVIVASAATVTLAAWLWLGGSGASHGFHPGILGPHRHDVDVSSFLYAVVMWQAMMVAMMTPAFLQWMLTFAALTAGPKRGAARFMLVPALASGYFVAWLVYGVVGAAAQIALQRVGLLADGRLAGASGGAVLIAAGLFQFAPFKRACLTHCRNPLSYLLSRWRGGPAGGFRLGIHHGAYCVACCWLLMITGFAMGVMNLAWMAGLTIVIASEQVLPLGDRIGRAAGLAMAGWGVALIL